MNRLLTIIVCALALAGCASAGIQVKEDQLTQFMPGQTTVAQVIAKLGQPNLTTTRADGTRDIGYVYSKTSVRAETFIPIVGSFVGGADTMTNTVMLHFDKNGTLLDHSASTGQFGAGTGFGAGSPAARTDRPKEVKP